MNRYSIFYSYSEDGKEWNSVTSVLFDSTAAGAVEQIKKLYPYTTNIQILSVLTY